MPPSLALDTRQKQRKVPPGKMWQGINLALELIKGATTNFSLKINRHISDIRKLRIGVVEGAWLVDWEQEPDSSYTHYEAVAVDSSPELQKERTDSWWWPFQSVVLSVLF